MPPAEDAGLDNRMLYWPSKLWKAVAEAVRGEPRDYTAGSIRMAIWMLAIPMILEMTMESVFAVTDIFFAGRLGANAVATIGLTESMLTIVYTVAIGLSIGATALIARRIGEKDSNGAETAAVQAILLGAIVSIFLGIIGLAAAPRLLMLMGATPEVVAQGTSYVRVMMGGNIVILSLFLGNAIFRGAGDGTIAMRSLFLSNLINVVLDPCLIFGLLFFPKLGVVGAAYSTTIARGIGACYTLTHLFRGKGRIKITRDHWRIDPGVMLTMWRLSWTGMFQTFIAMASWIGLVRVISNFGSDALAGYTIGIRIVLFALFPAFGLCNAAATMVGQCLGARKPDRAESAVWMACRYNLYFLGFMDVIFVVFAPLIVGFFTTETGVAGYAISCLRIVAAGFLFYAYGMVLAQSFNGAGDTWTPTKINFYVFWLFEIPVAYILSTVVRLGPTGVFLAILLGFSTFAVAGALVFRKGAWKTKAV